MSGGRKVHVKLGTGGKTPWWGQDAVVAPLTKSFHPMLHALAVAWLASIAHPIIRPLLAALPAPSSPPISLPSVSLKFRFKFGLPIPVRSSASVAPGDPSTWSADARRQVPVPL
jgi:hypothetical protein